LRYLSGKFGEVSAERACSGMSIGDLYDFLRESDAYPEAPALAAKLHGVADRTPLIAEAGVNERSGNPLAAAAIDLFIENLASEAGNLALKTFSTGGVYFAGGMPIHVLPLLKNGTFIETFAAKGRLSSVLKQMPVHVVMINAAILGAAVHGMAALASR
jgi:glucokinase